MSADVWAVYSAVFSKPVARPLIGWRASCGFPSPAEDYVEGSLDLASYLVKHRAATFYVRVSGDSMMGANIHPGNLLVVDRAAEAHDGHIVVARIDDTLCVRRLHTIEGRVWLTAENPDYDPIEVTAETDFEVWGRVMHSVQSFC